MAITFATTNGTLGIPNAYVSYQVQQGASGVATTGVITIVGEADAGPDWTLESDITENSYGPDELSDVLAKYKSGQIVDGYRACQVPSIDPQIPGSPNLIYIVKTNKSTKASAALQRSGLANYGVAADQSWGQLGNNLYVTTVVSTPEIAPTTGAITWIPTPSGATLQVRQNGGAVESNSIVAKATVAASVGSITSGSATGLQALANTMAIGGVDRGVVTGLTGTLAVAATGNNIVITLAGGSLAWATTPQAGDTVLIPGASGDYGASAGSVIKGGSSQNAGAYIVTAASATTISATKLRNNVSGALAAPAAVSAVSISGTPANDLLAQSPVTIENQTGTDRGVVSAGMIGVDVVGTLVSGNLVVTLSTGVWAAIPQVNDVVSIPSTAPATISNAAGGWYQVVSATSTTVVLSRLSTDRAATAFSSTALSAITDITCLRPGIDGLGKAMEIQDGGGSDNVSTVLYNTSGVAVSWISTSVAPVVLRSGAEEAVTTQVQRNSDSVNESWTAGGSDVLNVGYEGTTATLTINSTGLTTTVTGGMGANLNIPFAGLVVINDLVAKIDSNPGYTCTVGSALYGNLPVASLDQGTWSIASTNGTAVVGIKDDAYAWFQAMSSHSSHVQLGLTVSAQASAGLPDGQAATFLAGGARGPTTGSYMTAAIDACQNITTNFLVPLVSQNASVDAVSGITDSGSTYQIAAVNAYALSHVALMSQEIRNMPRLGSLSVRDTFANAMAAASNLSAARTMMNFLDVKAASLQGTIVQYQPWYLACIAASMQAAGGYRSIFNKQINVSGLVQAAGDFNAKDNTAVTKAFNAGLEVARALPQGGFAFVSDQTTYTIADNNPIYNSWQAMYAADVIAQTLQVRMNQAFTGKSLADVSGALVLSVLKGIMTDLRTLKYVATSDGIPEGYNNVSIKISGPVMQVSLGVVEATCLYYTVINFLVQVSQQTAQG